MERTHTSQLPGWCFRLRSRQKCQRTQFTQLKRRRESLISSKLMLCDGEKRKKMFKIHREIDVVSHTTWQFHSQFPSVYNVKYRQFCRLIHFIFGIFVFKVKILKENWVVDSKKKIKPSNRDSTALSNSIRFDRENWSIWPFDSVDFFDRIRTLINNNQSNKYFINFFNFFIFHFHSTFSTD